MHLLSNLRQNSLLILPLIWHRTGLVHNHILVHCYLNMSKNQKSRTLDRKQDLNILYQVSVFRTDRKNKMAARPLICWDVFDFSSETAERNSTKLDRKQDLNVLYQVCVFRADRKTKMTALASDWLKHLRLLGNR